MQIKNSKINIIGFAYSTISITYLFLLWYWYIYGYEISVTKVGNNKNDLNSCILFFATSQFFWITFKTYFNRHKVIESVFHSIILLFTFPLIHSSGKVVESINLYLMLILILSFLLIRIKIVE